MRLGNLFSDPESPIGSANGVASSTVEFTADGRRSSVVYDNSAGNADNNVAFIAGLDSSKDRFIVALELTSSMAATFNIGVYPNDSNYSVSLRANEPTLVVWFGNKPPGGWGSTSVRIYPVAAGAPTLKLRWGQALAGNFNDPVFMAAADQIAGGAYDPNTPTGSTSQPSASAPTDNARPVGSFVANSSPTAGGTLGWVHVGSGTWKAVAVAS